MSHAKAEALTRTSIRLLGAAACFVAWALPACADESDCGLLTNHFGPFDYYKARREDREIVETRHFTANVEQLRSGNTGAIATELSYTLGVFPNHPRALFAMSQLALREKSERPRHSRYSIYCWFDRAIRFRPEDGNVHMLFGSYLVKTKRVKEALPELDRAAELAGDDANLNYNLGLAYFELSSFEKANLFAQRAYRLGFALPGLRNMLIRSGHWREGDAALPPVANGAPPETRPSLATDRPSQLSPEAAVSPSR